MLRSLLMTINSKFRMRRSHDLSIRQTRVQARQEIVSNNHLPRTLMIPRQGRLNRLAWIHTFAYAVPCQPNCGISCLKLGPSKDSSLPPVGFMIRAKPCTAGRIQTEPGGRLVCYL